MPDEKPYKTDSRVRRVYLKADNGDLTLNDLRAFVDACSELDGTSDIRVHNVWGGSNAIGGDPYYCKAIETEQRDKYEEAAGA